MLTLRTLFMRLRLWIIRREVFIRKTTILPHTEYGSHYGAWGVVDDSLDESSVVYSFGVGEDISFDLKLIEQFKCSIHAFDPTPRSQKWFKTNNSSENIIFHTYGLSGSNNTIKLYEPSNDKYVSYSVMNKGLRGGGYIEAKVKNLSTIMTSLDHDHVDLLKMDIEGSEYDVIDSLCDNLIIPNQLLIEFHHRFSGVGIKKTKRALSQLAGLGYKIFYVSNRGHEIGFIHSNLLEKFK